MRYFFRQAMQSMRRSPVLQLVSVSTIAVSMLVLFVFVALSHNLEQLAQRWSGELRLVVFLAEDADAERLAEVAERIEGWSEVTQVIARTRAQTFADFRAELGDEDVLLAGVDEAMMPAVIEVLPRAEAQAGAALDALAERIRATPGVGEIGDLDDGRDLVQRLRRLRDLIQIGAFFLAGLVALSVVFIIANTVRLGLYARRDEIEVMQLVGATDNFVRAPYYIEGGAQGLLGALVALGILLLAYRFGLPDQVVTFELFRLDVTLPPTRVLATLVLGGMGVGVLASHLAVTRYLRQRSAE